jgi:undecaprenyl-diphosphatase
LLAFLIVAISIFGYFQLSDNFYCVEKGLIYRCAQPSAKLIGRAVEEHKIKSVLNLRGENNNSDWYEEEINASKQYGVAHFDYRMSARRELNATQIQEVLTLINKAPKPLLIHCKAGADRTGLVSALCRLSLGDTPQRADEQLSLLYGHFPYLLSNTDAMDKSYWKFVEQNKTYLKSKKD